MKILLSLICMLAVPGLAIAESLPSRIAFGSCARPKTDQPVWDTILAQKPDLFIFLGDNIYASGKDVGQFEELYAMLGQKPGYQALREAVPVLAMWDDHDYGLNDGGAENPIKDEAKAKFMEFFVVPDDSPMRGRGGVYDSKIFEADGKRLQVILLDTRWFRSELVVMPEEKRFDKGRYGPNTDADATVLGEDQWKWLEKELRTPADLRIIVSSIQVIPAEHGFEKWANFPAEQERFFALLAETGAENTILLSGDRHFSEISQLDPEDGPLGSPLVEVTASALNQGGSLFREPNKHRVTKEGFGGANYGWMEIDWDADSPKVSLSIRDALTGEPVLEHAFSSASEAG